MNSNLLNADAVLIFISLSLAIIAIVLAIILWRVFRRCEFLSSQIDKIDGVKELERSMQHNASMWRDDYYENIKSLMKKAAFQANIDNEKNKDHPYPYRILYSNDAWNECITPENVLMLIDKIEDLESKREPTDFIVPDYMDKFYWYQIYPGAKFRSLKYLRDLHNAGKDQGFNIIIKGRP